VLAYIHDETLKRQAHAQQRNYWEAYIPEICDQLGVRGTPLDLKQLENSENLKDLKILIVGRQSGLRITQRIKLALDAWVREGGLLIGFGCHGLDHVFGIETRFTNLQTPDEYSIAAGFELYPHPITAGVHSLMQMDQKLLILSEFESVCLKDGAELARLHNKDGRDRKEPAITWRVLEKGYAAYFAFDVAQTAWLLHQGRPITEYPEGQGYLNTCHLQVLGENSRQVRYADEIALVLQNMMAFQQQPFIYPIPPEGDTLPDALLFWGGDEYFGPAEVSVQSSDWMKTHGLPYHMNIGIERNRGKGDGHPMTPEELQHILDNGHEVSLYYMLYDDDNYTMTEAGIKRQFDLFEQRFGFKPVCTLHYNTSWLGWVEPGRWMAKAGGKADNSFGCGVPRRHDHPWRNSPWFGFGQGTGYPFFFREDWQHGNSHIDFIEEPVVCYEIGHRGLSTRGRDPDLDARVAYEVHTPIDMAAEHHLVINMFYHPASIIRRPAAREAIEEVLHYIDYRKLNILHMANNQVAEWWMSRSRSSVGDVAPHPGGVRFTATCDYAKGMVVKLRLSEPTPPAATCDGQSLTPFMRREFGGHWVHLIIPTGKHEIDVTHPAQAEGKERGE